MTGLELLRVLIESTGLPPESLEMEIHTLITRAGLEAQTLTLDQVRELLVDYLQDALTEAKASV